MPKGTRHPVAYPDVVVGNWYQARFAFKVDNEIGTSPAIGDLPTSASSRGTTRNKSHRVMVLTKFPDAASPLHGRAICVFLTSFGGRLDLATTIPSSFQRHKYLAVNTTAQPPTSPYSPIPISVRALHGFVDFTADYNLPIGSGGGDAAIVRMREAGKGNAEVSSPDWAAEYIRRLKVAWVMWLLFQQGDEAKWVETAKGVTAEFGHPVAVGEDVAVAVSVAGPSGGGAAGTKRLVDDEDDDDQEDDDDDRDPGSKGKGKAKKPTAKRQRSGPRWLDGSNETDEDQFEDSGIHDTYGEVAEAPEIAEAKSKPAEPGVYHAASASLPVLVSVALYDLDDGDEDGIDEEVDFGLLDALFRPIR